jgi:hypothetical protein
MNEIGKVELNHRYTAAYTEIAARIAQRQQAINFYVAVVAVIVAGLVNARSSATAEDLTVWPLFYGIPIASICFASLTLKHELMLTNLRSYVAELEKIGNEDLALPSYNVEKKWRRWSLVWRRFHDVASAILVVASNGFSFFVMRKVYPEEFTLNSTVFFLTVVVSLLCIVAVIFPAFWKRWKEPA